MEEVLWIRNPVYIPIKRIPIKGGMTIPYIGSLDPGTPVEASIWVFPKIGVFYPPNHPFYCNRVFHEINHPFWGTIICGNTHIPKDPDMS